MNLHLHLSRGKCRNLLLKSLRNPWVHSSTPSHYQRLIQILPHVDIALHDGVERNAVDLWDVTLDRFLGIEKGLWASELLVPNRDDVAVGELELDIFIGGLGELFHFVFVVEGDIAFFLLDGSNDFELSR